MKRLIATVVATAMVVGSTGSAMAKKVKRPIKHRPAAHHVQAPYAYNQHNAYRRSNNNNGAALAFGMLAIGTIAAIAASKNGGNVNFGYGTSYGPQPYVPPPAYGGYGPAGYGYAPAYAPPPVREYERETVVEYRREYERVREVGY